MTTVPCRMCGEPTINDGTKLCNPCWELNRRVDNDPEAAVRILKAIGRWPEPWTVKAGRIVKAIVVVLFWLLLVSGFVIAVFLLPG